MLNISTKISKSLCFKEEFANGQDGPIFYYTMVKSKTEMYTACHLNTQKGHQTPRGLARLGIAGVGWQFFPEKTFKLKHEAQ